MKDGYAAASLPRRMTSTFAFFRHGEHASHEPLCGLQHVPEHEDTNTDFSFLLFVTRRLLAPGLLFGIDISSINLFCLSLAFTDLFSSPPCIHCDFALCHYWPSCPFFLLSLSPYCDLLLRRWVGVIVFIDACVSVRALGGASSLFRFVSLCSCYGLA